MYVTATPLYNDWNGDPLTYIPTIGDYTACEIFSNNEIFKTRSSNNFFCLVEAETQVNSFQFSPYVLISIKYSIFLANDPIYWETRPLENIHIWQGRSIVKISFINMTICMSSEKELKKI